MLYSLIHNRCRFVVSSTLLVMALCLVPMAQAATVPFTEDLSSGDAGWQDGLGATPTRIASGGPENSAYLSYDFNFQGTTVGGFPPVFFRANTSSSSGAFVGNWIADGVSQLSFQMRHNAPEALSFYARLASPINSPGAIGVDFTPVPTNTWQTVTIPIVDNNPPFISYSGSDFNTIFSNIGNMQFGVNVPPSLAGQDVTYTFDIANVSIIPEPASLMLLAAGGLVALRRRPRDARN